MSNLADHLRNSLTRARGNEQIRQRLCEMANDPKWMDSIVTELGANHGLVRELRQITGRKAA